MIEAMRSERLVTVLVLVLAGVVLAALAFEIESLSPGSSPSHSVHYNARCR